MSDDKDAVCREVVEKLKQTRKYRWTCDATLRRVAAWAAARHDAPKAALKSAKRKLHQVYGAYVTPGDLERIERLIDAIPAGATEEALGAACRAILECHASTRERLPILEEAYLVLADATGPLTRVLDVACGLNPFALPWLDLPRDAVYLANDIDSRLVAAVNRFLARLGRAPTAECRDVLVDPPDMEVDVALLLKTAPCLERQEKGAVLRLLRRLRARHVVVSFPLQSLGGRNKGMAGHYGRFMEGLLGELGVMARQLEFATEVFYVFRSP